MIDLCSELAGGEAVDGSVDGPSRKPGQPTAGVQAPEPQISSRMLARALRNGELFLAYQPQVDAERGTLVGFEALLRWQSPTLGLVPPNRFIPLAESDGLIHRLWDFVLDRLAHDRQHLKGQPTLHVAVNLSARQLPRPDLADRFATWLQASATDASQVHVEITESALLSHTPRLEHNLNRLRELGISIWLDDFGTGYSSLRNLRDLPISGLKVDRSFVSALETNLDDFRIVSAIVAMANSLGLQVVAEGVETETQAQILSQLGCSTLQGFLIGRPTPIAEQLSAWRLAGARRGPARPAS
jgi:EAL domain-containing protein (putative c-di-GMP-specific phosphodiesterase class I)